MTMHRQRGVVLVLVLWVVVVLAILATSLAYDVQVNSRLTRLQREQFVAYNMARSGIAVAMTHLSNDLIIDFQENQQQPYDAFSDVWAQPGVRMDERATPLLPGGNLRSSSRREKDPRTPTYEFVVNDEEGKIPINAATPRLLKAIFEVYGFESPDSDLLAAAVADYKDADDVSQAQDAAGMKETEYWSSLTGQDVRAIRDGQAPAVTMSNEAILSVDQLMDIPGIPPEIFYGFDPDDPEAAAAFRARAGEISHKSGKSAGRSPRQNRRQGAKARENLAPLRDILTVRTFGTAAANRINVNTAPVEVLTILLYASSNFTNLEGARTTAEAIAKARGEDRDDRALEPEDAFKGPNDLERVGGANLGLLKPLASNSGALGVSLSFKSDTFEITGIGRVGSTDRVVTCWVQRVLEAYNPDDPRLGDVKDSFRSKRGGFASRKGGLGKSGDASGDGARPDRLIRLPAVRVIGWSE